MRRLGCQNTAHLWKTPGLCSPQPNARTALAQLLVILLRLESNLSAHLPPLTGSVHSRFPDKGLQQDQMPIKNHALLKKVDDYIQLHLHKPLNASAIARHIRLSPVHLNRIMKSHIDSSIMEYVFRQRMEIARIHLLNDDFSVQKICHLVGYTHPSHFSRSFQKYAGASPLKYRQLHAGLRPSDVPFVPSKRGDF